MHHHRSEHWIVVADTARVSNGDKVYDVHTNESTYIPMSAKHRLENQGRIPLQIIEVQTAIILKRIILLDLMMCIRERPRSSCP